MFQLHSQRFKTMHGVKLPLPGCKVVRKNNSFNCSEDENDFHQFFQICNNFIHQAFRLLLIIVIYVSHTTAKDRYHKPSSTNDGQPPVAVGSNPSSDETNFHKIVFKKPETKKNLRILEARTEILDHKNHARPQSTRRSKHSKYE